MAKAGKYAHRVVQGDAGWTAEITRRVTSKRVMVSKSQDGFASEAEAQAWAEKALVEFLQNLKARNKRHSQQREARQQEQ